MSNLKYNVTRQKTRFNLVNDGFMDSESFRDAISLCTTDKQRNDIYKGVKEALEAWIDSKQKGIEKGEQIKGNCRLLFDNEDFGTKLYRYAQIEDENIDFDIKNELINNFGEYCALKGFPIEEKRIKVLFNSFDWWNYKNFQKSLTVKENIAKMELLLDDSKVDDKEFVKAKEFKAIEKIIGE